MRAKRILVVASDPERRRKLAHRIARDGVHVLEAHSPLEGLWRAPDVDAVAVDRGDAPELVPLAVA